MATATDTITVKLDLDTTDAERKLYELNAELLDIARRIGERTRALARTIPAAAPISGGLTTAADAQRVLDSTADAVRQALASRYAAPVLTDQVVEDVRAHLTVALGLATPDVRTAF